MLIEDGSYDDNSNPEDIVSQYKPTKCLWRFNETVAMTEPCNASNSKDKRDKKRMVGLSVIQYQNTAAVSPKLPKFSDGAEVKSVDGTGSEHSSTELNDNESHLTSFSRCSSSFSSLLLAT